MWVYVGLVGEGFQGQVVGEVGGNLFQQCGQMWGVVWFWGQLGVELGLVVRMFEEYYQVLCDVECQVVVEVGFDQCQGQVDFCCDVG